MGFLDTMIRLDMDLNLKLKYDCYTFQSIKENINLKSNCKNCGANDYKDNKCKYCGTKH